MIQLGVQGCSIFKAWFEREEGVCPHEQIGAQFLSMAGINKVNGANGHLFQDLRDDISKALRGLGSRGRGGTAQVAKTYHAHLCGNVLVYVGGVHPHMSSHGCQPSEHGQNFGRIDAGAGAALIAFQTMPGTGDAPSERQKAQKGFREPHDGISFVQDVQKDETPVYA